MIRRSSTIEVTGSESAMVHTKVTSFKNSKGKTVTLTLGDLGVDGYASMAERKKLRDEFKATLEASRKGDGKAMGRVASVVDRVNERKSASGPETPEMKKLLANGGAISLDIGNLSYDSPSKSFVLTNNRGQNTYINATPKEMGKRIEKMRSRAEGKGFDNRESRGFRDKQAEVNALVQRERKGVADWMSRKPAFDVTAFGSASVNSELGQRLVRARTDTIYRGGTAYTIARVNAPSRAFPTGSLSLTEKGLFRGKSPRKLQVDFGRTAESLFSNLKGESPRNNPNIDAGVRLQEY